MYLEEILVKRTIFVEFMYNIYIYIFGTKCKSYIIKGKWLDEVNICFITIQKINCLTNNRCIYMVKIVPIRIQEIKNTNWVSSPTLNPPTHAYIFNNNCYIVLFLHLLVIVHHHQESISFVFLQVHIVFYTFINTL